MTKEPNPARQVVSKLRSFVAGELTLAELEGMSWEEAKSIAEAGCDLASAGRLEEARVLFEGLVAGNPKDAAAQAALGTVYQKLGRMGDAEQAYSAALAQSPANPVALTHRGELRLRRGDREGLLDLSAALDADPAGETAAGRRAKALVQAIASMAMESAKAAKAPHAA